MIFTFNACKNSGRKTVGTSPVLPQPATMTSSPAKKSILFNVSWLFIKQKLLN